MSESRVGFGYDVHRLVDGRPLVLGGVTIPSPLGLDGHSDADVLLHAITDALLGAAGERDIGFHFPNTDPRWKDVSSELLLREAYQIVRKSGFRVVNVDSTLLAEAPKIQPYIESMKEKIAAALGIEIALCGVKATTNEMIGFVGRQEGMAAMAVILLERD